MGSKDNYKGAVKIARKELRSAWSSYRTQIKKFKLLRKQAEVKDALAQMGVTSRQIPVVIENSKAYKVKVRIA